MVWWRPNEGTRMLMIIRNGPPNNYDHAPQGTICKVMINDQCHERYVQRSSDEEKPEWDYLGVFYNSDD